MTNGPRTGQKVAVKKQKTRDARDEIEFLRMLDHVNVVKFFGSKPCGLKRGYTLMALELCSRSLHDHLHRSYPQGLPEFEIVQLISDFLHGYSHLIDRGVLHGDIKSANILVDLQGNYKIADFGLAQHMPENGKLSQISGSYDHCHPVIFEQLYWRIIHPQTSRPNNRMWPASIDIWSIAVTFFEAATGSLPFVADTTLMMYWVRDAQNT